MGAAAVAGRRASRRRDRWRPDPRARRARGAPPRSGPRSRRAGRCVVAAKTVVATRPSSSITGPPELPGRTSPRSEVIDRSHRPAAVGVGGDDAPGRPEPRGAQVERARQREAHDRPGLARVRLVRELERLGARAPARAGSRGRCGCRSARRRRRAAAPRRPGAPPCRPARRRRARWSRRSPAPRPSPSRRRRARRRCRGSASRESSAARTSGSRAMPRGGGATSADGPSTCGKGSSRRSEFSSGPDGGSAVLSRCRIAERWTSIRIR